MLDSLRTNLTYWVKGIRFYIAWAILLMSLEAWWWASASYGGSVLFALRLEEVYAWFALGLLGLAISIGPFYKIFPKALGRRVVSDARRLVGIGAAWFSVLHVAIAYVSLFKLANPLTLPKTYLESFTLGFLALLILLVLALTSFDAAFKSMGKWWFRLHRLVYVGILLVLLHAFMIGAHATRWPVLILLSITSVVLLAMHCYIVFVRQRRPTIWQLLTIGTITVLLIAIFNYGYSQKLDGDPIGQKASGQRG